MFGQAHFVVFGDIILLSYSVEMWAGAKRRLLIRFDLWKNKFSSYLVIMWGQRYSWAWGGGGGGGSQNLPSALAITMQID